jgi:putative FmdB family regulatory protein
MPIYEFGCTSCGHSEEIMLPINEEPKLRCPVCQHWMQLRISNVSAQYVGDGWAKLDRKREKR